MAFWQQDVPDTAWSGHDEDPIPVLLGRWGWSAFLYRWFACRPLDGKTRNNGTWRNAPTAFYSKTGAVPWPAVWHKQPRWRQAVLTRLLPSSWALSHVLVLWIGGFSPLFSYIVWEWKHLLLPPLHFIWWLVTLWS